MQILALVLSAASLVLAQNVIPIQVGSTATAVGGVFQFIPNNVTAQMGDIIMFNFSGAPGNHSVTQSNFSDPCTPLATGGFDSGFVFIPNNSSTTTPVFNLTITNASEPIWFFCQQLNPMPHCSSGMVGAINPPTTGNNTFPNFMSNAKAFVGNSGQETGFLSGQGAVATALPSPLASGESLVGTPTGASNNTAAPTNTAPTSSTSSNTTGTGGSGALSITGGQGWMTLLAALLGVALV